MYLAKDKNCQFFKSPDFRSCSAISIDIPLLVILDLQITITAILSEICQFF